MSAPVVKTTFKIVTEPGLKQKLKRMMDDRFDDVKDAFILEMEDTLGESAEECPVLTGTLRDSRSLDVDERPGTIKARLGYGANYAFWVHERTELHHPTGKSKFLEDPVNRKREVLIKNIVERVG